MRVDHQNETRRDALSFQPIAGVTSVEPLWARLLLIVRQAWPQSARQTTNFSMRMSSKL